MATPLEWYPIIPDIIIPPLHNSWTVYNIKSYIKYPIGVTITATGAGSIIQGNNLTVTPGELAAGAFATVTLTAQEMAKALIKR